MKIYLAGMGHQVQENEALAKRGNYLISYASLQKWFPVDHWWKARLKWIIKTNENISCRHRSRE